MLFNNFTAESIITLTALVFAYFFSVSLVGYLQARLALYLGDDTPAAAGFLTLNPLVHMDVIGFTLLILLGFGWGRAMPIDPNMIRGPNRSVKLLLLYAIEPILCLILASLALCGAVLILGPHQVGLIKSFIKEMFYSGSVPFKRFALQYPAHSSLGLVSALLLMALVFFNIFLATLSLILNGFRYALVVGFDKGYSYTKYADYFVFLFPLLVVFFFADPLRKVLLNIIVSIAMLVARFFGAF
jgi:hypothetical protein